MKRENDPTTIWEALANLQQWQRDNIPGGGSAVSIEVLLWLLRTRHEPCPLKDLYLSSRASEPTVRKMLREYVHAGLIELEIDDDDHRNRHPRVTSRFDAVMSLYKQELARFAELIGAGA